MLTMKQNDKLSRNTWSLLQITKSLSGYKKKLRWLAVGGDGGYIFRESQVGSETGILWVFLLLFGGSEGGPHGPRW